MSYKSIVALTFGHAGDASTLRFAAALAVLNKARVVVFPVMPDPMVDLVSYGMLLGTTLPDETTSAILASQKAARATLETECRRICNAADLTSETERAFPAWRWPLPRAGRRSH